ncbi:MAG: phage protease [Burkholderiales bacterium]|nr:phage protease [Burkholderiales bacterium]
MIRRAYAAFTVTLDPSRKDVRLIPAGQFRAVDGRPKNIPGWKLDAALAARVIARVADRADARVVDYEHQTIYSEKNGQPAPAAGWFKNLEWREGDGLYATDMEWTERAVGHIAAKEYRYISPVFAYDQKTGEVLDILHAGITNNAGLDGLTDLATLAAKFDADHSPADQGDNIPKEKSMSVILRKLLGLAEDADEKAVEGAVTALKANADKTATLETEVAALKATAPDPAKFVPADTVKALQTEVATLTAQIHGRAVDEMIAAGLKDGRILPAMESWARDLGKKSVADLKSYLDNASPVAALHGTQTGGREPGGGKDGALSEEELAVCKQMAIDPEAYKKDKAAAAA